MRGEFINDAYAIFLCPHLPLAGVGHIAFHRDVTSAHAYVCMSRSPGSSLPASLGPNLRPCFSCS